MTTRELSGARVAVVGASGALGSRIARELAAAGARLLLVGRDADRLAATGVEGTPVVAADISSSGEAIVRAAQDGLGGLDGLVHAAGVVAFGPLADTDDAVIEELFLTNVVGPLVVLNRVLPLLQASRGFVVNLSAVVAERPLPGMVAYSASKAALTAAGTALGAELRRSGVGVLDVRPPHTETGLAGRPLAGTPPRLPHGLDPDVVARRVVAAIAAGDRELASGDFTGG
jgi:short-subunit dehydrogenase